MRIHTQGWGVGGALALLALAGCSETQELSSTERAFTGACQSYVGQVEDWFVRDLTGDMGSEAEVREAVESARLGETLCPCMLSAEQAVYGDAFGQSKQVDYPMLFAFLGQHSFYQFGGPNAESIVLSGADKDAFRLFAASHEQCTPDAAVAL